MNLTTMFLALMGLAFAGGQDYRIGPGDVVVVTVYGHDFGSETFPVAASGEIKFPHVGKVSLAGQTTFEAEEALRTALMDGYLNDPQVTVRVEEFRSQPVEILGAVEKPGLYYLQGPTSARALISEAGGIQSEKSTGQIMVTSKSGEVLTIPIADLEGPFGDHKLSVGDVVRVDEGHLVFVAGEVQKPGAIPFVEGITVMEALLQAGGSTGIARLSGAYVLRGEEKLEVNLRRVIKGKSADFTLEAGDRIVIPESPI